MDDDEPTRKLKRSTIVHIRDYSYDTAEKPLGDGSYGVVYKGRHTRTKKHIAIKIVALYPEDYKTGVSCELLREFSFLKTFRNEPSSESILFPLDMFIHDNSVVMIFPLLEETLFHYITRTTSQDRRQNVVLFESIVNELIRGMHFCARHNIRHNDIHASNILVTIPTQTIKLTDLGLCTYDPALPWLAWSTIYHWSYYQAPELAKCLVREPIDEKFVIDNRVDIWSFGVVLIEYGAPHWIKDMVKRRLFPLYMYDPSAHPKDPNDPNTLRLSMKGSSEYYQQVMDHWKRYMFEESDEITTVPMREFYVRLFVLLRNIFTTYEMRWNIFTCYEYWIQQKSKLVIYDYTIHDCSWLSKFTYVLHRFQTYPLLLTCKSDDMPREISILTGLFQEWFDASHNLIYTLECFRLLYDYLMKRIHAQNDRSDNYAIESTYYYVYEKTSKKWHKALQIGCAEWEELYQAIFALVYKLLHNTAKPDHGSCPQFKINIYAERTLLHYLDFNIWSSWIRAKPNTNLKITFHPKHVSRDLQHIQRFVQECVEIEKKE